MAWKYIGDGSFLAGVPARDLTDEEYAEYAKAFKEREGVPLEKAPEFAQLYAREADAKAAKED
jgi:hypothetical protein